MRRGGSATGPALAARTGLTIAALASVAATPAVSPEEDWIDEVRARDGIVRVVAPGGASCLNLRAAPSVENRPLACLPPGTRVELLSTEGDWLTVRLADGRSGWMVGRALVPGGDGEAAAAKSESSNAPGASRPETRVDSPSNVQRQGLEAPSLVVDSGTSRCLNVRPTPATTHAPLACLQTGTRVEKVDSYAEWLAIRIPDGRVGWSVARALEPAPPAERGAEPTRSGAGSREGGTPDSTAKPEP